MRRATAALGTCSSWVHAWGHVLVLLPGLGDRLGQYVANVLVRLHSVVECHASDCLCELRLALGLDVGIQHLLLLQEELLLLLLKHPLLEHLLELDLYFLWELLSLILIDWRPVLIEVAFSIRLAILRVLRVRGVLQQLDDLFSGEVVRNVAYLALERLDVALATAHHLLLLYLHQKLLAVLLGHLVELALALAILLVRRGLSDDTFGAVAVHSLSAALDTI